jgi:hypothetical protein
VVTGRSQAMFFVGLAASAVTVAAFFVGIRFGAVGVARAYAIANTCLAVPVMLIGHRIAGLELRRTLAVIAPLLVASIVMAVCVVFAGILSQAADFRIRLVLEIAVGVVIYLLGVRISAPDLWQEAQSYLFPSRVLTARALAAGIGT